MQETDMDRQIDRQDQRMTGNLLVDRMWNTFKTKFGLVEEEFEAARVVHFGGGFCGQARVIRTAEPYTDRRVGFGVKWNETRQSYFLRAYLHRPEWAHFQTLVEKEVPGVAGEDPFRDGEPLMADLVLLAMDRLDDRLQKRTELSGL